MPFIIFEKLSTEIMRKSPGLKSKDLAVYVKNTLVENNHFLDTCSMRHNTEDSVVNSHF